MCKNNQNCQKCIISLEKENTHKFSTHTHTAKHMQLYITDFLSK